MALRSPRQQQRSQAAWQAGVWISGQPGPAASPARWAASGAATAAPQQAPPAAALRQRPLLAPPAWTRQRWLGAALRVAPPTPPPRWTAAPAAGCCCLTAPSALTSWAASAARQASQRQRRPLQRQRQRLPVPRQLSAPARATLARWRCWRRCLRPAAPQRHNSSGSRQSSNSLCRSQRCRLVAPTASARRRQHRRTRRRRRLFRKPWHWLLRLPAAPPRAGGCRCAVCLWASQLQRRQARVAPAPLRAGLSKWSRLTAFWPAQPLRPGASTARSRRGGGTAGRRVRALRDRRPALRRARCKTTARTRTSRVRGLRCDGVLPRRRLLLLWCLGPCTWRLCSTALTGCPTPQPCSARAPGAAPGPAQQPGRQ